MKSSRGFTVIELLIVVAVLLAASVIFFVQKNHVEVAARDTARKTSINAMYYSLEEVYFKEHKSYPRTVSAEVLPSVDPALFKDPNGVKIGESSSNFRYEPLNCTGNDCKGYELRSSLEGEADYIKQNRTANS
jgi:prepilin-type N-terminal cleavage/methylation domain-containing protein